VWVGSGGTWLNKDFLQVYSFKDVTSEIAAALIVSVVVGKKNLFHNVFSQVEFPAIHTLQLEEGEGSSLGQEYICNLQHAIVIRSIFIAVWFVCIVVIPLLRICLCILREVRHDRRKRFRVKQDKQGRVFAALAGRVQADILVFILQRH